MPSSKAFITIGDLLKAEADYRSRIKIPAPVGTKIGQLVTHPSRYEPLVALSDEEGGNVLVQPHNCTIYLDNIDPADIAAYDHGGDIPIPMTAATLIAQGDKHGIKYITTNV